MRSWLRRTAPSGDDGASAVEYGLLVAGIAAIIILVVFALGTFVKGSFHDTCKSIDDTGWVNRAGPASQQSCDS